MSLSQSANQINGYGFFVTANERIVYLIDKIFKIDYVSVFMQ